MKEFDYIIIGGGPTGLTLALYLSKYNKKAPGNFECANSLYSMSFDCTHLINEVNLA